MHTKNHDMEQLFNFDDIATQMAALKTAIFNAIDTNDHKIQFIKEELAAGRYEIQNELIAERMLEFVHTITPAEIEVEMV